jgi:hypothetical protein
LEPKIGGIGLAPFRDKRSSQVPQLVTVFVLEDKKIGSGAREGRERGESGKETTLFETKTETSMTASSVLLGLGAGGSIQPQFLFHLSSS